MSEQFIKNEIVLRERKNLLKPEKVRCIMLTGAYLRVNGDIIFQVKALIGLVRAMCSRECLGLGTLSGGAANIHREMCLRALSPGGED